MYGNNNMFCSPSLLLCSKLKAYYLPLNQQGRNLNVGSDTKGPSRPGGVRIHLNIVFFVNWDFRRTNDPRPRTRPPLMDKITGKIKKRDKNERSLNDIFYHIFTF